MDTQAIELTVDVNDSKEQAFSVRSNEIDIDLDSMNDEQKIAALKAKVVELKRIIVQLKNGYDISEPTTERLRITTLVAKETVIKKVTITQEIMLQQNEMRRVIDKHAATVDEWLVDNADISKMCDAKSLITYALELDGDDSKKQITVEELIENHGSGSNNACVLLLEQHSVCHDLIAKQYERMKLVTDNVNEIFVQKREIIRLLRDYEKTITIERERVIEILSQFEDVHDKTVELKAVLDKALSDYDEQVKAENISNIEQWNITSTITRTEEEMKAFDEFIVPCARVMRKYQLFQRLTLSNTTFLTKRLISEWDVLEKIWYTWNVTDFIHWVRYKLEWFDHEIANKYIVEVEIIENQLRNRMYIDFDGDGFLDLNLHIMSMNDLLIFFNLSAKNHDLLRNVDDINTFIKVMVLKYPHDFGISEKKVSQFYTVPERFQCALTHEIMREPVFVFDGYTYERSAILAYLKEHHRSPITDDTFIDRVQFLEMERDYDVDGDDDDHHLSEDEEQMLRDAEDKRYMLYFDTKLMEEIEVFNETNGKDTGAGKYGSVKKIARMCGGTRKYSSAVAPSIGFGGSISSGSVKSGVISRQKRSYTSSSTDVDTSSSVTTVTITEKTVLTERLDVAQ